MLCLQWGGKLSLKSLKASALNPTPLPSHPCALGLRDSYLTRLSLRAIYFFNKKKLNIIVLGAPSMF